MRIAGVLVLIWLAIGAIAGGQRHYYNSTPTTCVKAGNIALTIVAGPLNYFGVNPSARRRSRAASRRPSPAVQVGDDNAPTPWNADHTALDVGKGQR